MSKRKRVPPAVEPSLRPGQVLCKPILLRKLDSRDLLVSHYSKDERCWKLDSVLGDFRTADPSKVVCFEKAVDHIMNKTNGKNPRGRPRRDRKSFCVRLTPAVHGYCETLMTATEVDFSTLVAYLICVAHSAYAMQSVENQAGAHS